MYLLGSLTGSLLLMLLMSRGARAAAFGRARGLLWAVGPNAVALVFVTALGGFMMPEAGEPRFDHAFLSYAPATLLLTIVDLFRASWGPPDPPEQPSA